MSASEVETPARPVDLRLARLHLRLGSLELARAELEAFAGAGVLDPEALLDLAEIRWRTGDVAGAGVAAEAYLGEGGAEPIALVIAAEASAAQGRPMEARRLAARALEQEVALDRLFAGIPRSAVWPIEPADRPRPVGELFAIPPARAGTPTAPDEAGSLAGADEPEPGELAGAIVPAALAATASLWDEPGATADPGLGAAVAAVDAPRPAAEAVLPTPDPASELAAARVDLAAGRMMDAATRLAISLRLAPSLAVDVLAALDDATAGGPLPPVLELVRGDAYRHAGQEVEARQCYAAAAAALGEARAARD
jgi:hypothetical protein